MLGTSLPWLLPHAIGDLQSINQLAAARPGWRGRLGETIRQVGDLEHWQAFRSSFDRFTQMVTAAATGPDAPVSISVLSGDVHHSYAAQVDLPGPGDDPDGAGFFGAAAAVHQLTCSPVHNVVDWFIRPGFRLGWSRTIARATRWWAGRAGVPPLEVSWHRLGGPAVRQHGRHAGSGRATRRGHVPAAAVGGRGTRGRPAGADRRAARRVDARRRGCHRDVIDRSSPSRVRAARGG